MSIDADLQRALLGFGMSYMQATRIEMSRNTAMTLAHELDMKLSPDWGPKDGEAAGEYNGIPIYINNAVPVFTILGCHILPGVSR